VPPAGVIDTVPELEVKGDTPMTSAAEVPLTIRLSAKLAVPWTLIVFSPPAVNPTTVLADPAVGLFRFVVSLPAPVFTSRTS
jgi:hypothetical protein